MEKATKGLVLFAGVLLLAACGGSSSPAPTPTTPPQQPSPPPPPPPPKETTIVFSAHPMLVAPGAATELRWSSPEADYCTALGAWSGHRATGGRELSPVVTEAVSFRLRCDGPGGAAERTVQVEPEPPLRITDRYGRTLGGDREIVLVDWEGYMTNPVVEFYIEARAGSALPGTVTLSTGHKRLYLDAVGRNDITNGHVRTIEIRSNEPVRARLSSFTDDDTEDGEHALTIRFKDANGDATETTIRVLEIDHDRDRPHEFNVTVDFSEDHEKFFDSEHKRSLLRKAAENWTYFFDDMALDPVGYGDERTTLWNSHPDGFVDSYPVTNVSRYTGFLLYAQGFTSNLLRSGGSASEVGQLHTAGGETRPLRRSGSVQIELKGEYESPGWFLSQGSDDAGHPWWEVADLLHTAQHETGHALLFSDGYPRAAEFRARGEIRDERVRAYFGDYPKLDRDYHLATVIDPESQKGAFGNNRGGPMLTRRWIPTKLDLLVAQAIGYELRPTSAFRELEIVASPALPDGYADLPYATPLAAVGGIPFYNWTVVVGTLPDGLELDAYDGVIYGTPAETGRFEFTVKTEEYGGTSVTRTFSLSVG